MTCLSSPLALAGQAMPDPDPARDAFSLRYRGVAYPPVARARAARPVGLWLVYRGVPHQSGQPVTTAGPRALPLRYRGIPH